MLWRGHNFVKSLYKMLGTFCKWSNAPAKDNIFRNVFAHNLNLSCDFCLYGIFWLKTF
jgi:hypothetical protein